MSENYKEMMARVRAMASGDPTWDLSENDLAALRHVLHMHDAHKAVAGDYVRDLTACAEAAGLQYADTPMAIVAAIRRLRESARADAFPANVADPEGEARRRRPDQEPR